MSKAVDSYAKLMLELRDGVAQYERAVTEALQQAGFAELTHDHAYILMAIDAGHDRPASLDRSPYYPKTNAYYPRRQLEKGGYIGRKKAFGYSALEVTPRGRSVLVALWEIHAQQRAALEATGISIEDMSLRRAVLVLGASTKGTS